MSRPSTPSFITVINERKNWQDMPAGGGRQRLIVCHDLAAMMSHALATFCHDLPVRFSNSRTHCLPGGVMTCQNGAGENRTSLSGYAGVLMLHWLLAARLSLWHVRQRVTASNTMPS